MSWPSLLHSIRTAFDASHRWLNETHAAITERMEAAVAMLVEVFSEPSEPHENLGDLAMHLAAVAEAWDAWHAAAASDHHALPADAFWDALRQAKALAEEMALPPTKRLESVPELLEQKVPDRQICSIYGWLENGDPRRPVYRMLEEEKKTPGIHTGKHVDPREARRKATIARLRSEADQLMVAWQRKQKLDKPAPESIEDLLAVKGREGTMLTATQIARMKRTTVAEIYAYCDANNLPRPAESYTPLTATASKFDQETPEPVARAYRYRQQNPTSPLLTGGHRPGQPGRVPADPIDDDDPALGLAAAEGPAARADGEPADGEGLDVAGQVLYHHRQGMRPGEIGRELGLNLKQVREILTQSENG